MAKTIKAALAAVGCIALLLAGIYVFRESLLRAGINTFLEGDIAVTSLEGVQLGSRHAAITRVELILGTSGQQLTITDIDLDFSMESLFSMPVVENLVVGSARLTNSPDVADAAQTPSATGTDQNSDGPQDSSLLLSELLQQLREFPLKKIALNDLEMPQFTQKLALNLEQQPDVLQLDLASGSLQLRVTFTQQSADATAQLMLVLQTDATTVAELELVLQPQAEGYTLAGNGKVEFSDANTPFAEYLTTPLPLSSVALQWNLAADVTDDLFNDPAGVVIIGVVPGSTLVLRPGLVPDLGELAITIPESAQLSLVPGADMSIATGTIPLRLVGSWQQQALQSVVTLTPNDCQLDGARDCSVSFDGTASLAAYTITGADPTAATTINAVEFAGNGNAKIGGELMELKLDAGARLASGAITGPGYNILSTNITSESVLDVSSSLVEPEITISAEEISLALTELKAGEYQVSPAFSLLALNLESADQLTGTMTLQTAGLTATGPQWLPVIGLAANLSIDGDVVAFDTPLLLPNAPADAQLQASGTYDLAVGTGEVNIKLPPLTLTGPENSLSSYFGGWPYPADVMTGTLALDVAVRVQPAANTVEAGAATASDMGITGSTKIVLTDIAGFYAENFFRGLTTTIDATYDSSASSLPVTTPPLTLSAAEINVGMPITNVMLAYQLDADSQIANISSISAEILDGIVSGMDINYDFSEERNEMNFMFAGLRLERMLELAEYDGIEAIGAVSGNLPVTIDGGKVEVDAGRLYAEEPGGSIRYLDAPPAGQGNPAMDLVNQALSNYQFQSLDSTIDYSPDGELLLAMQLRGNNPDMNGGQPINLNLNISDNIPQLLRSLQAGRAIEDFLQEQYK